MAAEPLSEQEKAILAFERQWWRYPGAKEQAIREVFSISATRYYQEPQGAAVQARGRGWWAAHGELDGRGRYT